MEPLIFDIETAGLRWNDPVRVCAWDDGGTFGTGDERACINKIIDALYEGRRIVGHNIIAFDLPVLARSDWSCRGHQLIRALQEQPHLICDTVVWSRLTNVHWHDHSMAAWIKALQRMGVPARPKPEVEDWSGDLEPIIHRAKEDVANQRLIYLSLVKAGADGEEINAPIQQFAPFFIEALTHGVPADDRGLCTALRKQLLKVARLKHRAGHTLKCPGLNPGSVDQVHDALEAMGLEGLPLGRETPTGQRRRQFNQQNKYDLLMEMPELQTVLDYRDAAKELDVLDSTKKGSLFHPDHFDPASRRVHPTLGLCAQNSNRSGYSKPAAGNVPRHMRGLCRDYNWVWLGADVTGLEYRVMAESMAHLDDTLLQEAESGVNPKHRTLECFSHLMGAIPEDRKLDEAKRFFYAHCYGQGWKASMALLKCDQSRKREFFEACAERFPGMSRFQDELVRQVTDGVLLNAYGLPIKVQSHTVLNQYVQSTAAWYAYRLFSVYWRCLRRVSEETGVTVQPVLANHDEVQVMVHKEGRDTEAAIERALWMGQKAADETMETYESTWGERPSAPLEIKAGESWRESH